MSLIDEYLDAVEQSKPFGSPKTRSDYRKYILSAVEFLNSSGLTAPTEAYYEALEAKLSAFYSPSTMQKKVLPPIRKFFAWATKKGDTPMIKNTAAVETIPPSVDSTEERRKPGRKPKGNEPRDKKISVYLTASLLSDAQDLARIDGLRFPDYLFGLIEADALNRQSKLDALRALRS